MMMQARPRTAGAAARRKQRAMATARARSDSRQDVSRPQSRSQSAMGARARSASLVANGTTGSAHGIKTSGSGEGGYVGPSMVIPKVLFILFMVCLIVGGILVAITTLEDPKLGSAKLTGVFIIVGGALFLIAAIVVCLCKKAHWAADHTDDDNGATSKNAPTATSGSGARRAKYAANLVEDETSRPPTRAWNMDGTKPTSAASTADIKMTLTSERQDNLFSISGSGAGNGGYLTDDQLTFRTTPQIKITCEEDEEEKIGNLTTAADIESSNSEDVNIVIGDENLVDTARPDGIPALDLSGVFPSPSADRKSFENEGFSFDLADETLPEGSAPSTASFGASSSVDSPSGTQQNQRNDGSDWSTGRSEPPVAGVNGDIELKVIKADVTDNLDLIQPETTFKGSELIAPDVTVSNEKVGVSGNVSPRSETEDHRAEDDDSVPFDLDLLVGGRGRVE